MNLCAELAEFAVAPGLAFGAAPTQAARRTLLNSVAVAAGGSSSLATAIAWGVAARFSESEVATIIGHPARSDARTAALVNGVSAHVEDFDDTHMATIVHPGAAVVPAALAAAELEGADGEALLKAIVVGVEVALRIGIAIYPAAFASGWHMSGVVGPVGAAVAAGRLLQLDADAMRSAIVIAASQAAGTQEALGTMTKALHLGKAAANGLEASLLARAGCPTAAEGIADRGGLIAIFGGREGDPSLVLDGLGRTWEIEKNSFKPYACGVVSHAAIDAAIRLHASGCDWRRVVKVTARTNPVVLDVMGVKAPNDELQAKFSIYHCVAIGLRLGAAAPAQFRDEIVRDTEIVALRNLVEVQLDPECAVEESEVIAGLADGSTQASHVRHALGTPLAPLSDDDLVKKARLAASERLGITRSEAMIEALLGIADSPSITDALALAVPAAGLEA